MTTPHIERIDGHIVIHDPIAHLDRDDPDTFCDECRGIATRQFNAMADLPGGPVDGDYVADLVRRLREQAEADADAQAIPFVCGQCGRGYESAPAPGVDFWRCWVCNGPVGPVVLQAEREEDHAAEREREGLRRTMLSAWTPPDDDHTAARFEDLRRFVETDDGRMETIGAAPSTLFPNARNDVVRGPHVPEHFHEVEHYGVTQAHDGFSEHLHDTQGHPYAVFRAKDDASSEDSPDAWQR